jgi:hypothetical protein
MVKFLQLAVRAIIIALLHRLALKAHNQFQKQHAVPAEYTIKMLGGVLFPKMQQFLGAQCW